jgi:hypothetical protein
MFWVRIDTPKTTPTASPPSLQRPKKSASEPSYKLAFENSAVPLKKVIQPIIEQAPSNLGRLDFDLQDYPRQPRCHAGRSLPTWYRSRTVPGPCRSATVCGIENGCWCEPFECNPIVFQQTTLQIRTRINAHRTNEHKPMPESRGGAGSFVFLGLRDSARRLAAFGFLNRALRPCPVSQEMCDECIRLCNSGCARAMAGHRSTCAKCSRIARPSHKHVERAMHHIH